MIATHQPLGQLLVNRGFVQPEQLERALGEQQKGNHRKLIGEVLVEMKCCAEEHISQALALAYDLPFARLSPRMVDRRIVASLPAEFLTRHQILPLFCVEKALTVAVSEPANLFLLEEIQRVAGCEVQLVVATTRDIESMLHSCLRDDQAFAVDKLVDEVGPEQFAIIPARNQQAAKLDYSQTNPSAVKLVNRCIYNAAKSGASDIHIEPDDGLLRIRYRIDGRLTEALRPPFQMHAAVVSYVRMIAGLIACEPQIPQDSAIRVAIDQRAVDLRVSMMPGRFGEKVVVRIVDHGKPLLNLEKLGFGYETLKQWRKLIRLPSGVVLVTGPTGSGKSTTLYACLAELNRADVNICTIEDPVEKNMVGVNQFQTNERNGFTFAAALRSVLRQDPDVIMLGEIRDSETARLATQGALTGHLVLSAMQTADAPSAVARLFHLGVEPYLVGATVSGVLAQRLVRKLCQQCKAPVPPTANERRQIEKFAGDVDVLYKPRGCERCRNLGFTGRVGIYELLVPDDAMAEKISNGATLNEIRQMASAIGMRALRADGIEKVKAGITTLEEVHRVTA